MHATRQVQGPIRTLNGLPPTGTSLGKPRPSIDGCAAIRNGFCDASLCSRAACSDSRSRLNQPGVLADVSLRARLEIRGDQFRYSTCRGQPVLERWAVFRLDIGSPIEDCDAPLGFQNAFCLREGRHSIGISCQTLARKMRSHAESGRAIRSASARTSSMFDAAEEEIFFSGVRASRLAHRPQSPGLRCRPRGQAAARNIRCPRLNPPR